MAGRDSDDDSDTEWAPPKQPEWYKSKANTTSSNSMSQTNVREGYGITTLEVVELVEDLTSYVKKKDLLEKIQSEKSQSQLLKSLRSPTSKDWLAVAKCTRLRNAQIPKVFHEAAAGTIWTMMLAKVRQYGAKVKTEDPSNTPTPTLSETAQRRSSSVVSNRSTASITDKFGVASLTEPAILNDANVALVDAVHHSVVKQFPMFRLMTKESQQKLEENYFEVRAQHLKYDALIQHLSLPKYSDWYQAGTSQVMDALTMTLIEDDDDLLGTVNSHIKSRRLGAPSPPKKRGRHSKLIPDGPPLKRRKTEAADSRHAKASGGRTKKDKDSEDSDTGSDVPRPRRRDRAAARARSAERKRLGKEAQLKKTRDEEELAKAKKEKEEKEARERETQPDGPLDSDDYRSDSSSDIDPEDDSEDEEATTAKDLAREQKEKACDFTPYQLTDAYILYFKELSSDNGGIFANAMGMGKTRAMVLAVLMGHVHFKNWTEVQNARAEGDATEHNAVDDDDKPCPTEGERTFHCACERSPSFNAEPRQAATMMTGWGRAADAWKNEVVAMDLANSTWCDPSDPLALRFCFFSDSPPENMGRPTKEEAMEMRIDTTDAISKALAAANKLVAPRSYVLGGVDHRETVYWTIPEANTPAVHPEATKHRPAPSAARFVIVCGFGKVDKHVFRAYNTMSVTAQRTIIRKGGPHVEKRAILLPGHVTVWGRTVFDEFHNCKSEGTIMAKFYQDIRSHNHGYQWKAWALSGTPMEQGLNEILIFVSLALIGLQNRKGVSNWFNATDKRDSVTGDRIYKMEDAVYRSIAETPSHRTRQNTALNGLAMAKQWRNMIANVKHDASEHESSHEYKELISQGAAVAQRFMLKRTLKTRDPWGKPISGIKGDFLPYFQSCPCPDFLSTVQNAEQQCRDILEKEGLDESEASRRVIFNRFEMQAIASYPALATLKAAQFKTYGSRKVKRFTSNSVKDLFTNPSKDHFLAVTWLGLREKFGDESVLVMQGGMTQHEINLKLAKWRDPDGPWIMVASMAFAEAITLTEATHVVIMEPQDRQNTQDQFMFRVYRLGQLAEMCVGIVYFNPDSELELKVLGKQDVKTTSRDKLQGGGSTVTDQRMDWHQTEPIVMSLEALC
ncbi:hypothetical protein SNOG_16589 [Parastagonospora nodorum SN15]|uniref:Helicase C-terminal domain-containing protein n=1 Tax=Phaeosphaeria nodorum (strain SN15 / ATCC MYA-4574 / FGSC 10173) TaxID=321614 RepID=Q0TV86_PHANO|nr:hypothetical protein SNOG_16589 [Parastagonospora nodorum SN15]EAT92627.2 hypothetical protein SNOG_16589 [Parastagonospora nodorum SN15]